MTDRVNYAAADNQTEDTLFINYRENPAIESRNEIINRYLYLPEILSRKFVNRGIDYEDIYQVACIALIKAVERFDPEKGVKFSSFATPTIIGEVKRYFRDKGNIIRIPRRIYEAYRKVNEAREALSQEMQKAPRIEDIAARVGISEENVIEIMESWNTLNIQSFDQSIYADEDIELRDIISAEDDSFEKVENQDFLERSLDRFNEAEKRFLKMRFFNKNTQKEIAEKLGVSQMYVSRLEKKVLGKFRMLMGK